MGDEGVKIIRPFLQRADEISKKFPKIAYYCRLHAVEEGFRLPQRSEELMSLVRNLMGQLEKDKPKLELSDKKTDHEYCEAFAVQVFNRADETDRAGKADLSTARSFYAAYLFLDVLNHFSPIDEDLAAKQKYAVWKAADIRKAVKEGRRPVAGSPADIKILLRPGAKVLFAAEPTDKPVQGTVAKIELIDGEQVYTVALAGSFVQAPMSCLALEVSAGDQVIYTGAGSDMPATVQAMDVQYWYAPGYLSRTLCISQTLVSQSLAQGEGSCRVGGKSLFEDHVHRLRKLVVGCRQMREWEFASHAGLRRMYLPWKMGVSGTLVQSPFVYPHQHHARRRFRFLLLINHLDAMIQVLGLL
uniref:Vta1/callose synthase N-terminal domain-containing protein n=1 Tax=Tetraselmis chuii TaxID=63592 RepID=A0A7S1WZ57_9CHLO|mmetsp:Transcript_13014/g.23135  ORF Transcript_13014/g.23135 Transcript_13014/m.23135 type:complete len:358 (+) Transcript_13014:128-1201(+)